MKLSVCSTKLKKNNYMDVSTGGYYADVLIMKLSDGSQAECWIDSNGVLNVGGYVAGFEAGPDDFEDTFDIGEEHAKRYFNIQ